MSRRRGLAELTAALRAPTAECRALETVALAIAWLPSDRRRRRLRELAGALDWELLLMTAERHRVAGLVAHGLADAGIVVPEPVRGRLRQRAAAIALAELACAGEARRLDARLHAAGITTITLKGVAVAMQAFGRLGLRQNHDIDLLVAPEEMAAALFALGGAGYAPVAPAAPREARRPWSRRPKDTPLRHAASGQLVELHHRLFENAFLMPLAAAPRVAVALPGGARLQALAPAVTLVYLAAHAAQHLWSRLKWLADVHALVGSWTPADLASAYAEADRHGARRMLSATLLLCAVVFDEPPAPESLRDWGRDVRLRIMVRLGVRMLIECGPRELEDIRFGSTRKNMAHYLLSSSPRYLLREFRYDLGDASNVPPPPSIAWLGPLARPLAWTWRRAQTRGVWREG